MPIDPVEENLMFSDDAKFVADMLRDNWSLGPDDIPTIAYTPEEYMTSARVAFIYVYQISRYNSVSTTDYSTLQRTSFVAVRTSTRFREKFYQYMQEIYRILLANRRLGQSALNGYTYFEIINDRSSNDLSGWYTNTLDLKFTSYNYPIYSAGFGDIINKQVNDLNNQ